MKRKHWILTVCVMMVPLILSPFYYRKKVYLMFTGDILLGRNVGEKLREQGYDYPYEKVKPIIREADILMGNLEGPITEAVHPVFKQRELIFKGDIVNGKALKEAGFDVLNLANNHTMDYGSEGLADTISTLEEAGIYTVGAGTGGEEAKKPLLIRKKGRRFGFVSYSVFPPEGYISRPDGVDVAKVDMNTLEEEIRKGKEQCDFLVVSFHWGNEYDFLPSESQKRMAHMAVDCGADVVIGHHPHVLQSVEEYQGKLIMYSLGNFIFDRQIQPGTDESVILSVELSRHQSYRARLIPIKIKDCRPHMPVGKEASGILERVRRLSEGYIESFEIIDGVGYIHGEKVE